MDELRSGLELATDEELQAMTEILFRRQFNPLDYLCTPEPAAVQRCDRTHQLDQLEHRVRFLAADGFTVLAQRTGQVSYRQILIQICRQLKVAYQNSWSTHDLESELFLELLEQTWHKLPKADQVALEQQLRQSLIATDQFQQLSPDWQRRPLMLLLKGSGALAVSSIIRPWLLQQLVKVQGRAALQIASRGMAVTAARYGATRSILTFLGPAMWTWFLADLGWRAVASNYTRVIPIVFTLAQIRLTRSTPEWKAA